MNQQALNVLFFGTPTFSTICLKDLLASPLFNVCGVVTQPDRPAGRGQKLQACPVKLLAIENNLPVFQPKKIKGSESEFLNDISRLGPIDFGVVIAFGQILPQAILDYPKFGCVNIHASLLPRWRGAAPIQRALLAGDKETGVCIMKMEAGLDTGPVYAKSSIEIAKDDSAISLHDTLSDIGAKLLVQTLPKIASGSLKAITQEQQGVTYADKISPLDLLIDWNESADSLIRKINTFSPKPGAYCLLDGKRLKILSAKPYIKVQNTSNSPNPGQIEEISENGLVVQTGHGQINIIDIQLEGKRAMAASEFIKGYPGLEGKVLGS